MTHRAEQERLRLLAAINMETRAEPNPLKLALWGIVMLLLVALMA